MARPTVDLISGPYFLQSIQLCRNFLYPGQTSQVDVDNHQSSFARFVHVWECRLLGLSSLSVKNLVLDEMSLECLRLVYSSTSRLKYAASLLAPF